MCDELTAEDTARYLSRRTFGAGAGALGLAAMLPRSADAMPVAGGRVLIATPDGTCDAHFAAPRDGRHPAVLVWPDIMGLRPAFERMGERLAESGYAVLTVNQFYRSTKAPFLAPGESFDQPDVRARITPWREKLTPAATTSDARAFVAWLDANGQVDARRPMGTTGYCMGGPAVFRTAAARADRVRAGATFHGAGLVTDGPDSPAKLVPEMKGGYLIAIAASDDDRSPGDKDVLRAAFADQKLPATVQVFAGTMHGWCPPDTKVYDHAAAERAWAEQLTLLKRRLA